MCHLADSMVYPPLIILTLLVFIYKSSFSQFIILYVLQLLYNPSVASPISLPWGNLSWTQRTHHNYMLRILFRAHFSRCSTCASIYPLMLSESSCSERCGPVIWIPISPSPPPSPIERSCLAAIYMHSQYTVFRASWTVLKAYHPPFSLVCVSAFWTVLLKR